MPWSRQLSAPIPLKDGRTLATFGDAREMMLSIPEVRQTALHWRHAAVMLSRAAQAKCGNLGISTISALIFDGCRTTKGQHRN
jgi:hypothetical protein